MTMVKMLAVMSMMTMIHRMINMTATAAVDDCDTNYKDYTFDDGNCWSSAPYDYRYFRQTYPLATNSSRVMHKDAKSHLHLNNPPLQPNRRTLRK